VRCAVQPCAQGRRLRPTDVGGGSAGAHRGHRPAGRGAPPDFKSAFYQLKRMSSIHLSSSCSQGIRLRPLGPGYQSGGPQPSRDTRVETPCVYAGFHRARRQTMPLWPMPSDTSRRETGVRGRSSYLASSLISRGRRPRPAAAKDEQRTKPLSQLPALRPGSISPPRNAVAARASARREPAPSIRQAD